MSKDHQEHVNITKAIANPLHGSCLFACPLNAIEADIKALESDIVRMLSEVTG